MNADDLRTLQAPLKTRYRSEPDAARIILRAKGGLDGTGVTCKVETGRALAVAGLHPLTGGDGLTLCSGDMLLEALVACAGVTLKAVAAALGLPLRSGEVTAEGEFDARGTLGVEQLETLLKLTERYCVVLQTLRAGPNVEASVERG